MNGKIKILYLSASPNDHENLNVDKEFRAIYEKVNRNLFEVISVSDTQAPDIQTQILKNNPEIIHFSGHASSDEILFENYEKKSQGVPKNALVDFFNDLHRKPRLIFFNACRTAENLGNLSQSVDFIIGTECAVFDTTAIIFAAKFYEVLSIGKNIKTAFNHAERELHILSIYKPQKRETNFDSNKYESGMNGSNNETGMYKLFIREGVDEKVLLGSRVNEKPEKKKSNDNRQTIKNSSVEKAVLIQNSEFGDLNL